MDQNTVYPNQVIVTNAREHDRNQLEVHVDDKETLYVFDRGYADDERFDRMTDEGYFFISRIKKNAVIREVESFTLCDHSNILRIITNRFDLSPERISDIYKPRWAIELFFKWLKQHVNIKHFYGMSENALLNQIYIALIAYCLHVLIQLKTKVKRHYYVSVDG